MHGYKFFMVFLSLPSPPRGSSGTEEHTPSPFLEEKVCSEPVPARLRAGKMKRCFVPVGELSQGSKDRGYRVNTSCSFQIYRFWGKSSSLPWPLVVQGWAVRRFQFNSIGWNFIFNVFPGRTWYLLGKGLKKSWKFTGMSSEKRGVVVSEVTWITRWEMKLREPSLLCAHIFGGFSLFNALIVCPVWVSSLV